MIRIAKRLPKYDWKIYAYFPVTTFHTDDIMEHLWEIGVDSANARRAYDNLQRGHLDTGFCYTNNNKRTTVIVLSKTSSADEFLDSLTHEICHACVHIAKVNNVPLHGEELAYMIGDLCREVYPDVKELLCDECRCKIYGENGKGYERR